MAKSKIQFFLLNVAVSIKDKKALTRFIELLFKKEETPISQINYVFCTDEYLKDLNSKYLKHNFFTDIITFNLSESSDDSSGEIYISVERVKENAKKLFIPFKQELHRVIFHGALHLCGYKDETDKQMALMRKKEDFYLGKYFK